LTMERIVGAIHKRHGSEIFAKANPLLDEGDTGIYGELVAAPRSGHRIHSDRVPQVLGRTLELGLQTIVLLPNRDPKSNLDLRFVKAVSFSCRKLARQLNRISDMDGMSDLLIRVGGGALEHVLKSPGETVLTAKHLANVASSQVRTVRVDSPNPQVRFALNLAWWIAVAAGRQHYRDLQDLIVAAFVATGVDPPRWVDRLAIEMNTKRRLKANWAKALRLHHTSPNRFI
jgi:hypothetical protein